MPPVKRLKLSFTFPQKPTYVLIVGKNHYDNKSEIVWAIRLSDNDFIGINDVQCIPTWNDETKMLTILFSNSTVGYEFKQMSAYPIYAEPDLSN